MERPFARWSAASLQSSVEQTAEWLADSLARFQREWQRPPHREQVVRYCDAVHELLRLLDLERLRMEVLADELRLRDRWAAAGQQRQVVEVNWTIARSGSHVRYVRTPE